MTFQNIKTQHTLSSKHILKFNNRIKKLWEGLISYFSFIGHAGTSLPNCYLGTKGGYTLRTLCLVMIGGTDIMSESDG